MRGIIQDMLITRKIEKTIKEVLNTLNAICFVAQSSNARLTANQKYIFISVFDLFGEDVKENLIAILTFCDGGTPQVVSSLEEIVYSVQLYLISKSPDYINLIIQQSSPVTEKMNSPKCFPSQARKVSMNLLKNE